ncbi:AAA family ATPase [Nostoc sp.]|uniref:AAA family ATPase n=1 Tax=Nostoc sp. TaxID=1180 RepID=UPI002FF8CAC9
MYIHNFRVRNYMIHKDTSIGLQPLSVLVGPNGGGKSALFDAMLNFSMLSRGNIQQAFGPYPYSYRSTIYRGSNNVARIGFEITMSETQASDRSYSYEIDYAQTDSLRPIFLIFQEKLTRNPDNKVLFDRTHEVNNITQSLQLENDRSLFSALRLYSSSNHSSLDSSLVYLTQQISRFNKFRLDPSTLSAPSRLPDLNNEQPTIPPRIGYLGEDLAATLYFLVETQHPSYSAICDKIRELVPEFDGFIFNTVGTDRVAFSIQYTDQRESIPSVRLSSGMLIYIGLIVLVLTPNRPPVLMIEEPENGLTPQALKAFYQAVRSLAFNENPEQRSQVLLSSHSPFVICEAWNGEDRDFIYQVKVKEGQALVRKFSTLIEEQEIHFAKDNDGQRTSLSLKNAEEIMSGYLSI